MSVTMGHQTTFSFDGVSMCGWCTLAKQATHLEREGTRGTRSHDVDDTREGPYTVSGQIILDPTAADLALIEPFAIGGDGNVAETLDAFDVISNKGPAIYTYPACKINKYTLSGKKGGLLRLVLDVVGTTEVAAGSAPGEPATAWPFAFSDVALTLVASARPVEEFELTIDNQLVADRFQNTLTVVDLPEGDRLVTLRSVHDFNAANLTLYNQALSGAAGSLVLYDGTATRTYIFGKLQVPAESPAAQDKGPMPLTLNMTARKDGETMEIAVAVV